VWFLESLDRVNQAIHGSSDLEEAVDATLDVVLEVFGCDRAWLLYPLDPDAVARSEMIERTTTEHPGIRELGIQLPNDEATDSVMRMALSSDVPLRFGPGAHPVPPAHADLFSIRSVLAVPVRPKFGDPWLFGLHQCSCVRTWTPDEERLFAEIGRRLADSLTSLLTYRNLRDSERKLADAQRVARVGYWQRDLLTDEITYSDETYRLFGLSPEVHELGLEAFQALLHPDDRPIMRGAYEAAVAGGRRYSLDYRVVLPDGEVRYIHSEGDIVRDEAGRPLHMFGTVQDITERKRGEERLSLFRSLIDQTSDMIEVIDYRTGRYLDVNEAACRNHGYTRDEYLELGVSDIDATSLRWQDAESRRRQAPFFESRHRRKDGSEFPVEVSVTYVTIDREYVLAVVRDITERKLTEGRLQLFRSLFDRTEDMIQVVDHETGRFIDVNETACRVHGYTREEYLSLRVPDIAPNAQQWTVTRDARQAGPSLFETVHRRKDGSLFPVEISIAYVELDRKYVLGVVRDISERKRAEESLALFRTLVDRTADAMEVVDYETGRFLDVNEAACRVHGYTRDEYLQLTVGDLDPTMAPWEERREDGRSQPPFYEAVHRRKDGSEFPVEMSVGYVTLDRQYILAVIRDISERKRAERALTESLGLLEAVVEGASDAVYVKDLDGRYLLINRAGAAYIGGSVADVVGRTDDELFEPESAREIRARDLRVMRAGRPGTFEEPVTVTSSGGTRTYLSTKNVYRDADGEVIGLIGISRDMTDFKHLEEQLRQSQKMEAVGRLAGGIAHDFNNLLTVMNGHAALVFADLDADDHHRESLVEILRAGERAAGLTRQLLAFSRKQLLEPRVLSLNTVLHDLGRMLERLIGEDIHLTLDLDPSLALTRVDPGQFEQAIVNLVVNARDAMPTGGRLTIATRNDRESGVLVEVRDTGHGMDTGTAENIFEPFFTTKPGIGTGLGLPMVYGFVTQSGGDVDLETAPGRGATFRIRLPATTATATTPELSQDDGEVPVGNETVLLVEDDDGVRALARIVLESHGYRVLEASDGDTAIQLSRGHHGAIDLLLSDVVMARMSGPQLADLLVLERPGLRVLFVSGYTGAAMLGDGLDSSDAALLPKPFDPVRLAQRVREILDAEP
jgi:PAS domain S-box-containing protein